MRLGTATLRSFGVGSLRGDLWARRSYATISRELQSSIPVIDIKPLEKALASASSLDYQNELLNVVGKLRGSPGFMNHGFCYVVNAPLSSQVMKEGIDAARQLFSQPLLEKMKIRPPVNLVKSKQGATRQNPNGYSTFSGVGIGEDGDLVDNEETRIEGFDMGPCDSRMLASRQAYYNLYDYGVYKHDTPNIWPKNDNGEFERVMTSYFEACRETSKLVMSAMSSLVWGVENSEALNAVHEGGDQTISVKKYPRLLLSHLRGDRIGREETLLSSNTSLSGMPHDPELSNLNRVAKDARVRMKAHTDLSTITLLASNEVGLEIFNNAENQWIDVEVVPGAVLVNVGDLLHRWSCGLLKSSIHRVSTKLNDASTQDKEHRYSIAFFCTPDWGTVIPDDVALPQCTIPRKAIEVASNETLFGDLVPFY